MRFNWITFKNFRGYGDYETKLELNKRETRLILGENGSGKTTFIDAIIWCLYGRSESPVEEVVNRYTKKDCKVEVNFDIGSDNYSVIRYRAHTEQGNKLYIFKDKGNISRRTTNDTQDLILEIIQIHYSAMVAIILCSSELYVPFLRSKVTDRLKIIESVLSMREIQEYYEVVREMRKPLIEKLAELSLSKEKTNSEIAANQKSIEEYKENIKRKLVELKEQKERLADEIGGLRADLDEAAKIDYQKEMQSNKLYDEINELNEQVLADMRREEKQLVDLAPFTEQIDDAKSQLRTLEVIDVEEELQLARKKKENDKKNQEINLEILKLSNGIVQLKDIPKMIALQEQEIEKLSKEIDKINAHIERCITCGQPVTAEFSKELISKKQVQISIFKAGIFENAKRIEEGERKNKEIKEQIEKLNLSKLPSVKSDYTEDYLTNLDKSREKLYSQIKLFENTVKEKQELNSHIRSRIKLLKSKLKELPEKSKYDIDYLERIKDIAADQERKIREREEEINLINERAKSIYDKKFIAGLETRIRILKKSLDDMMADVEVKRNEDSYYEVLQQLFSNKSSGIKKYLIEKMLVLFNEKVNFYLPFFFEEDISIIFDKDLNETITVDKTYQVSFKSFSSGEKTRFELAIALSLFALVKTFFSAAINLLAFDEILDQNLDKKGIQAMLEIIDSLATENSILVISHRDELKEYFGNQIAIMKDKNRFSKLAG